MLFRRRSRSRGSPAAESSPPKEAKNRTPRTLEEVITLDTSVGSSDESNRSYTRHQIDLGDSTDKHAAFESDAFESDAFAVLMPTTRLPIIDRPASPPKVASPAARAEALKAYQEKARQVRERNNSQGVRVPPKIVSYDYASRHVAIQHTSPEFEAKPPTPAGSFPISPPLPQIPWEKPASVLKTEPPPTSHSSTTPASPSSCYRMYRADSIAGASRSPASSTPLPSSIKVRMKPKPVVQERECVQMESRYALYNRPSDTSSTSTSRASSPVKSMPNFTASNSLYGDSIFGYKSKDLSGTVAGATPPPISAREQALEKARAKIEEREKKTTTPKRTLWPWRRPLGPRIAKPTTAPVVFSTPAKKPTPVLTPVPPKKTYIDPFANHSPMPIPPTLRPASPKKLAPTSRPATPVSTGTFDTGFAQIKRLTYIVFRIVFLLYALIALWYILDAVREAFNTIAAPFRVLKWYGEKVWEAGVWAWEGRWRR
ncbi:hypothetical protein CC86DRAFT_421039 [Ophiobolus disseminans]|uniref:Uncharacterized protein n=1 Tax=Ophiobolus disseminans TaxID=1469910 RepID=A0A6A6ZUP7_9PLEO|nr:hypothetical protein CC86DRAFT_421039 [Ophiobolus disseminans]